jgi:hypothetical protein
LSTRLSNSIVRTALYEDGSGGVGLFAINFAARSTIDVDLIGNRFVGGGICIDANAGVSRPDQVTGSTLSIDSHGNSYRFEGAHPDWQAAMQLIGSSGPPVDFPHVGAPTDNHFSFHSVDDRIEGFGYGIIGLGSKRFYGDAAAPAGNSLDLTLQGTLLSSLVLDLALVGAEANCDPASADVPCFSPGEDNVLRAVLRDLRGSGSQFTSYYAQTDNGAGPSSGDLAGTGNRLVITGNLNAFEKANRFVTPPSQDDFTGGGH